MAGTALHLFVAFSSSPLRLREIALTASDSWAHDFGRGHRSPRCLLFRLVVKGDGNLQGLGASRPLRIGWRLAGSGRAVDYSSPFT
jgi:hypothetical protein